MSLFETRERMHSLSESLVHFEGNISDSESFPLNKARDWKFWVVLVPNQLENNRVAVDLRRHDPNVLSMQWSKRPLLLTWLSFNPIIDN